MSYLHDKNEPSRFLGEGVSFKAKLIGILEVTEARGDRMCQEALADLKMAIRAAGEHKQRISVHVAIDGLRLRDEKTGDSLYHHPVHKISFIAQDMSDSRAFGYIFGSPDTGHRFFGIKTDKAASQVVIAMRDLFQVVFELKKKEIEMAKQQLDGKSITLASRYISSAALDTSKSLQSSNDGSLLSARSRLAGLSSSRLVSGEGASPGSASTSGTQRDAGTMSNNNTTSGGAVAELVDLEQELSSLQRGIHQMERLTPSADPFGDSFASTSGFLPPPPSSGRGRNSQASVANEGSSPFSPAPPPSSSANLSSRPHFTFEGSPQQTSISPPPSSKPKPPPIGLLEQSVSPTLVADATQAPTDTTSTTMQSTISSIFDVFTELDPLGTGRSKPYVDKKHFFQELKNPPKKVLKDLVPGLGQSEQTLQSKYESTPPKPELLATLTSVGRHSGGSVSIAKPQASSNQMFSSPSLFSSDPFAETDPFDNTDPFVESLKEDPFVGSSMDFANIQSDFSMPKLNQISKDSTLPDTKIGFEEPKISFPSPVSFQSDGAPLQVSLPPEMKTSPKLYRNPSTDSKSSIRQRPQSAKQQKQPPVQPSPSPPPPLPPKKPIDKIAGGDRSSEAAPPLPLPARRRPTPSGSLSWLSTTEDDYLQPIPPAPRRPVPSPTPNQGLDLTLAALLTCEMDELAGRLNIPVDELSKMTVAQLTSHLHKYIQTTGSTVNDITNKKDKEPSIADDKPPEVAERPAHTLESKVEFEANFEDNFSSVASETFVANFDNATFSNAAQSNPSYDRYAVFREIDVDEFKSLPDTTLNQEEPDSLSSQPDLPCDPIPAQPAELKPFSEFNIESLTVSSPSIKVTPQHNKLEELKNVISSLHKASLSPTPDIDITAAAGTKSPDSELKNNHSNAADRYAALRDLSAAESPRPLSADLPDEPVLSSPLQVPKERKRSDEKSDGFDHSDFFDCIDNSLSIVTTDDAFRKSPLINKSNETLKSPVPPAQVCQPSSTSQLKAPLGLASGSISDIASGSSPEIGLTGVESGGADSKLASEGSRRRGDAWSLLGAHGTGPDRESYSCQCSSEDSPPPQPKAWPAPSQHRRHRRTKPWHSRQTSSSSRDVSPWDEEPLPRDPLPHARSYHRERHESVGSRERRDSGGSRERRDSGSGRDRDRDRHRRPRRHSRDDDDDWSGDGGYGSRRPGSREARRERGWAQHEERRRPDERGYSTVGRREGRRRGEPPWQSEEATHRYASTMGNRGWRRSGSSGEGERRSTGERVRSSRHHRPSPRSHKPPFPDRSPSPTSTRPVRHRDRFFDDFNQSEMDSPIVTKNGGRFRFSNDFSEKDSPRSQTSPFENDFVDNVDHSSKKTASKYESTSKYDSSYANLDKESPLSARMSNFRFRYDKDISSECMSGSPASPRPRHSASPPPTARSLFEDDFSPEPRNGILRTTDTNGDHNRKETIHEGEELQVTSSRDEKTEKIVGFDFGSGKEGGVVPESRRSQKFNNKNRPKIEVDNIKKSESVNIFKRETDPFEDDDFFCSASNRPRKDNWQASFDNM